MKLLQRQLPGLINAVQAADRGSFTAAAHALDLSPAAVSKSIKVLEGLLGVRLFNRTTRQLSLTEEGRVFIDEVRGGLRILEDAAVCASDALAPQGLVRLNCPVGFGRRFIVPLLPDFYATYPDVQIELNLSDRRVDLVAEGFDVGIRGGTQPPLGMIARKLSDLSIILVATPDYLQKRGTPRHFNELKNHDLLRVKFLSGSMLPWHFKDPLADNDDLIALDWTAKLLLSDPDVMLDAVLMNLGIAALGRYHAHEALATGQIVQVLPDQFVGHTSSLSLFYPHRQGLAPRVRVFVDYLLRHLSRHPALQELP